METNSDQKQYKDYIRSSVKGWEVLSDDEIEFNKFKSLSNSVYKVTPKKEVEPTTLVFRVFHSTLYGQPKTNFGFITQEKENLIFEEMGKRGYGPKCYASNDKFRIEEYLDAEKIEVGAVNDPELRRWFVFSIANFNKLKIKGYENESPAYLKYFKTINLEELIKTINSKTFQPEQTALLDEIKNILKDEELENITKAHPNDIVMCHGDVNYFNILSDRKTRKISLVDYERGCLSFKGDEIGCFIFYSVLDVFQEDFKEYPENYPSNEVFRELAEYYIVFEDLNENTLESAETLIKDDQAFKSHVEKNYKSEELDQRVQSLVRNIKTSMMIFSFVTAFGSLKYNYLMNPTNKVLKYAHGAAKYYLKIKKELSL